VGAVAGRRVFESVPCNDPEAHIRRLEGAGGRNGPWGVASGGEEVREGVREEVREARRTGRKTV